MLHNFASFCCQLSTANDDLPFDVSVVVHRYSWRVDCVYLLRMSPLLRSFSTMDLCVSWIGQKCSGIKGSISKVAKAFICRGCLYPVTSAVRTSVDIGASAKLEFKHMLM